MTGQEILNKQVGHPLTDGVFQSFYIDEQLIVKINVVFLKFERWIHITVSEEKTIVKAIDAVEQIESFVIDNNKTFKYPLIKIEDEFSQFKRFIGQPFFHFSELVCFEDDKINCGLKLYFNNDLALVLYEDRINHDYLLNFSFDGKFPENLKEKITSQ